MKKTQCPACGRLTAYSRPHKGSPDRFLATLRKFVRHNDANGKPCPGGRT